VDGRESGEGAWLVLEGNATRLAPITTAGSFRFVVCITYLPFGSLPFHFSVIFCSTETAMCVHGGRYFFCCHSTSDRSQIKPFYQPVATPHLGPTQGNMLLWLHVFF
jgi:hypothetical protein